MREKVTAIIPTFNNEKIIRRCLESVKWADEILVVDSFSTDATLDICREYGTRIIQHEYINSALQKNWAIPQAKHDWIFCLDSDESLEKGAKEEILSLITDLGDSYEAARLPRKNYVFGKWIKGCGFYPDYVVRLYKKQYRYSAREVHAHIVVDDKKVKTLTYNIIHDDLDNLYSLLEKFSRYMKYELDELKKQNKKFTLKDVTLRPIYMFCWAYFYKRGFADGIRGFFLSVYKAYYNFMMYMMLWEGQEGIRALNSWRKSNRYEK